FAEVVRCYGGDFLPRFETVAASGFALWVETERADLGRRFSHAARQEITRELAAGDPSALRRGLQVARRLRDHNPHSQEAWQLVLRCLVAAGEHAEAAVEGQRLREFLKSHEFEAEFATRTRLGVGSARSTPGDS